jgi:hypothetical protein
MAKHPQALVHPFRITLVAFIDDLNSLEYSGLETDQCDAVLACLDSVINQLRGAPATSHWLPELLAPFGSLRAEYFSWNNPRDGMHPASHRRTQCKRIRKEKNGMLPRFRFGPLFATKDEQQVFVRVYDEFIRLENVRAIPAKSEAPFKKTVKRAREKQTALTEIA